MTDRLTARQLRRIQTLWGLVAREQEIEASRSREARLAWISTKIGREVGSCKELTRAEAKTAIDAMQNLLPADLVRQAPRDRDRDRGRAGRTSLTARRLDPQASRLGAITLPDAQTLGLLQTLLDALGWDRARLDLFLHSPKSPVRGSIRTLADANKVIWVLKSMLRRRNSAESSSARAASTAGAGSDRGNGGPASGLVGGHDRAAV